MQRIVGSTAKWEDLNHIEGDVSSRMPWIEGVIRQNRLYFLGLLAFLSLCTLVAYYLPPLLRADVYTNDMCDHVAWYQAAKNPALFQDDIMKTYFIAMSPLGYKAVFSTVCAYEEP